MRLDCPTREHLHHRRRYKSSVVHADTYRLICQRYIELNPARAAMVDDLAHYRWSSYRANALGRADARLTPLPRFNLETVVGRM